MAIRRRKGAPSQQPSIQHQHEDQDQDQAQAQAQAQAEAEIRPERKASPTADTSSRNPQKNGRRSAAPWHCVDTCCWLIGWLCVSWWALLVLYHTVPFLPRYVTQAIIGGGPPGDPPGVALRREGLRAKHPVVFVPGIVTGGLELWEGQPCADGLFRKRLWGGTFGEIYKRPLCWVEHMSLHNETGLDPPGVRVRPVSGLVAADYFAPGYFVWAVLIENLARLGYEEKSMHMAAYDWRLSFQNTEVRDKALTRLKSTIELMVQTNNGNKVVVVPHSMGVLYFLHFMKWVEAPLPMGGGGGPDWCAKHIKAILNLGGPLLGCPKTISILFSGEAKDIAVARAIAPGVMDSELFGLQTLQHIMRMMRSWDSTMSMIPKGGEAVWGGIDWSPEEDFDCSLKKYKEEGMGDNLKEMNASSPMTYHGRMLSFGKEAAEIENCASFFQDLKDQEVCRVAPVHNNVSCGDTWTEYHELSRECIQAVANQKIYTAGTVPELLSVVAPKLMERGSAHFSHGIADDLDDPKYQHYKHWSNPLETKLPNAPDIELFCMYGVGVLTERSYVYKISPESETCYIPFRIDTFAQGDSGSCLKGGVQFVDGDESVPVLSSGFMCAKGWRGKTRFNPSGAATFIREYKHSPPSNFLEGRGKHSASHVDMLGNFALIEDILRVAAGATGEDIGGERVYSDILKWSDRVSLKL